MTLAPVYPSARALMNVASIATVSPRIKPPWMSSSTRPAMILSSLSGPTRVRNLVRARKPDELPMDEYMFHLISTPEECIDKLNVYRDLGISELVLQFPTLGDGDLEGIRLFAETAIPAFR